MYKLFVVMLVVALLNGCTFNTTKKDVEITREKDVDEIISKFEAGKLANNSYLSICKAYAIKSTYIVHNKHAFNYSYSTVQVANELLFQFDEPSGWIESIPFYIVTPLAFTADIAIYPKRLIDHIKVPKEEKKKALEYLKLARECGYNEKYISLSQFGPKVKHIDQ